MVPDHDVRQRIGDEWIAGAGIEVGAGADPCAYRDVTEITIVDKRDRAELEALFRSDVAYRIVTPADACERFAGSADFLVAHHVFEHLPNPIAGLSEWLRWLKPGGRLFLSLPADAHACERKRVVTPLEHILDDFLFDRGGDHFESKQHIPHFINQWTAMEPGSFWYAQEGVAKFVDVSLGEVRRDGHDLHWHTYSAETLLRTVEAAFWFSGRGMRVLHRETLADLHYLVAEGAPRPPRPPEFIARRREQLAEAMTRIGE